MDSMSPSLIHSSIQRLGRLMFNLDRPTGTGRSLQDVEAAALMPWGLGE